jgi:hypothetical protein
MHLEKETQKAITQIPKEIEKLTKVIAVIGETLLEIKILKLEENKKEFKRVIEEEKNQRRGIS